jgi:hypothetical protein
MRLKQAGLSLALLAALAAAGLPAQAQRFEEHRGPFRGDIGHFHEHDWAVWHAGHWEHGFHDGRLGWWWLAGGVWYFYPYPIYPYPDPFVPPVVTAAPAVVETVPPPPTPTAWYYCNSAKGYYPYVPACPEGWQAVAASPAISSATSSAASSAAGSAPATPPPR